MELPESMTPSNVSRLLVTVVLPMSRGRRRTDMVTWTAPSRTVKVTAMGGPVGVCRQRNRRRRRAVWYTCNWRSCPAQLGSCRQGPLRLRVWLVVSSQGNQAVSPCQDRSNADNGAHHLRA